MRHRVARRAARACRPGGRSAPGPWPPAAVSLPVDIDDAVQLGPRGVAADHGCFAAWPLTKRDRRRSGVDSTCSHARQARQLERAPASHRLGGPDHDVAAHAPSVNCVSTMTSIASRKKLPMMTMATRRRDAADRQRRCAAAAARCCAAIMRSAGPMRSMPSALRAGRGGSAPGAGGRIASAGDRRTVAAIAWSVPSTAVATHDRRRGDQQPAARCGARSGEVEESAYSPVSMVPSQLAQHEPSTQPPATISAPASGSAARSRGSRSPAP